MYRRQKKDGLTEEELEIARYGLPPKYDGNRFRLRPEPGDPEEDEADEPAQKTGIVPARDGVRSVRDGLGRELAERLGSEELFIIALILILSGPGGDGGENASDVILLLALLLTVGRSG